MDDFPWEQVDSGNLESLQVVLFSSSTARRIRALQELRDRIASTLPSQIRQSVIGLLFTTYPRYVDRPSRQAVQQCLRELLKAPVPTEDLKYFTQKLQNEAAKPLAPGPALVLVEWCSIVLQILAEDSEAPLSAALDTIAVDARALDTCLAAAGSKQAVKISALRVTRRALRAVFGSAAWGEDAIRQSVQRLTSDATAGQKNAPFLGVISGVCARLPTRKPILEEQKKAIIAFYTKELVGSKSAPPPHIADALGDFFVAFVTYEDVAAELTPPFEKAMLRSPEVVFTGLLPSLCSSLPDDFDLAELLHTRLLKHLLSSMKSANPAIRQGAVRSFEALLSKSKSDTLLLKVTSEVVGPLKTQKITNPEQRAVYAQAIAAILPSVDISKEVVQGLVPVFSRESNEAALEQEIKSFCKHLTFLVHSKVKVNDDVVGAIVKGSSDKRVPFKKLWQLNVSEVFWQVEASTLASAEIEPLVNKYLGKMKELYNEVFSNPLPSAQGGSLSTAHIYLALLERSSPLASFDKAAWDETIAQAMVLNPKPSFLLNPKAYSKLASQAEIQWAVRALAAVTTSSKFDGAEDAAKTAWAQAFIYSITAPALHTSFRDESARALTEVYLKNAAGTSRIIINGLWAWILAFRTGEKESAPVSAGPESERHLHLVLKAICPPSSTLQAVEHIAADLKSQLVDLLLLSRPEIIPNASWISLCLRTGTDPGDLVREFADDCLKQLTRVQMDPVQSKIPRLNAAIWSAAGELAFVAPDAMVPRLVAQIREDLDVSRVSKFTPTDVAIARTPEGTMFVDVLSTKSKPAFDKNNKDYNILKWEEELRVQLAEKKGQKPKKLTADEQAKVKAQLAKESKIREEVLDEIKKIERGTGIIQGLASGPAIDADGWINPAVSALLALAEAGAGLFAGDVVSKAYIKCAEKLSSRLGPLRPFVGVATLRAIGQTHLPPDMEAESLGQLVTRILYRLRFASEQRPLDISSLAYVLPLLFLILDRNGIEEQKGEEEGEQVLLAIEVLSFHSSSFTDERLPRFEVLNHLLSAMQRYTQHYKLIKDTLFDFCRYISSNISQDELDVLLKGTIVSEASVRTSVLQVIEAEIDLTDLDFSEHIWLECHDHVEENAEIAENIWEENALEVDDSSYGKIIPYLASKDSHLRGAAARALAHAIESNPSVFDKIVSELQSKYSIEIQPKVPEKDSYGMPKKMDMTDHWEFRSGIALAFGAMTNLFEGEQIVGFLRFLIERGPLIDKSSVVRSQMAESGRSVIAARGQQVVEELMKLLETTLETSDKGSETSDLLNEAVVVLYGSLAQHLKADDPRLQTVLKKLLGTLPTPSESVQSAVSGCLPPLIRLCGPQQSGQYVKDMLDQLLQSKKYATQRGAAYGLAGIVSGRGISTLREFQVMAHLQDASENRKEPHQRQGALLAYELFATILGRTFEPYVIRIVPQLLASFGDVNADVRDACLDAAKACFSNLSSYGVKQILPTLLDGLDDTQWRSQKGACDLLGAMAYLDPQQLAASLPDIIPPLTVVLNDTHKEVRNAANRSLQRFGEVISNPEVKSLVNVLLKALSDPTKYTDEALDSLIKVSFVHYLDAPSLALVVRILERGLGDRSNTKRKSAQIIGSLAHLTERKDLISHLPIIVSGLQLAIVDPVPTTRATASKALGSLIEKLGEDALPDLIPNLMATLKSDTGAGDRLGSAQALSEVLAGLGTTRLEETLPTILQNVSSSKPSVREGFMTLFIFLPACFGNSFASYLSKIIPPILSGLADDVESIREVSLKAGRLLVKNFSSKAIDLLLPELERGLADDSYRIRLSSVELVGDLLFSITGITARADAEEEAEEAAQAGQSLLEVLGEERRNKVLSALFICRCDTSGLVKSAAMGVWKSLVASPKTLKDMVPTLSQLIIRRLGSSNMEHKVIASNALGDLIKKAGESVLATLLPTLEEGLQSSPDVDVRQGICIALRELITSASPEALEDYEKILISTVRVALVDNDEDVREAAAEAFDALQQILGKRAVDQVLPHLLLLLRNSDEAEQALSALLTLLTEQTRANIILPNLIPTLLTSPISAFNARALASLAEVASSAMTRRLPTILNSLMDNIVSTTDEELRQELSSAFDTILVSVDENDGLNVMVNAMMTLLKHDDHVRRATAAVHLKNFFANAEIDYSRYHQDLIRVLLISFDDGDKDVVKAAWAAQSELTAHLRKEEMEVLTIPTRQALRSVGVPGANLPGFSLPKGITAVLPIFLQGLLNGSVEQRTQAALAISDIIDRTGADSLKMFVTQITGPLIRVVSERSVDIKCAIFFTLNKLLEKIPLAVKPFLPQLQRTFARGLADSTSETLRNRAAKGLGILITLTPRVDPLIAELVTGTKTPDVGVRNAMMKALQEVVGKAGANMSEASKNAILALIDDEASDQTDAVAITNAKLLGALVKVLPPATAGPLIKNRVLTTNISHSSILGLNALLVEAPSALTEHYATETQAVICQGVTNKDPFISDNSVLAAGKYLLIEDEHRNFEDNKAIFEALAPCIQPGAPSDTRRLALVVMRTVSRLHPELTRPHLALLAPPIFGSVRDMVIPVKLAAEAAFLAIFSVVESESAVFDKYMAGPGAELPPGPKRSMSDYFKRVALRLASQARERKEAEGGQGGLGLSNDEVDDEKELWSIGKVDLGEGAFGDD